MSKLNIEEITVKTWEQIIEKYNNIFHNDWLFRGHQKANWTLETTFERAFLIYHGYDNFDNNQRGEELSKLLNKKYENRTIYSIEYHLIREFIRKINNYNYKNINEENFLECLALMQHYGAPTRLIDFTYSFYIALYFAIEKAEDDCAIYAINCNIFDKKIIKKMHKRDYKYLVNSSLDSDRELLRILKIKKNLKELKDRLKPFVYQLSPFNLNERITIQQGTFLCPADISKSFEDNLFNNCIKTKLNNPIKKIIVKYNSEERRKILFELNRMNINNSTLFPGLSGFALSLPVKFLIPESPFYKKY